MTPARAFSVALVGVEGTIVEVESAIGGGLPRMVIVGLADAALAEARERCRAAVHSQGLGWPSQLVTVNLSPATLPKSGAHFDLAIVASVSAAAAKFDPAVLERMVLFGELGLDGRVRPVRGLLPALLAAVGAGFATAVVPAAQLREASLVEGLTLWGVNDLLDLAAVLVGNHPDHPSRRPSRHPPIRPRPGISPMWPVNWRPSGRSRWRPPGGITCICTDHPVSARRCLPSACPASCPTSTGPRRSRCRRSTRWPACRWRAA